MKILVLISTILLFAGCAESETESAKSCSKPIQSHWVHEHIPYELNAALIPLDEPTAYAVEFFNGDRCDMTVVMSGSDCSGTITTSGAIYSGPNSDPGCSEYNGVSTYSISGSTLTTCDASDPTRCSTYK